jgi:DNA primase
MSRNIYKIKKFKHFEELQEINFFRPLCCIILSKQIIKEKEFYKNLMTTLNVLAHSSPYVCIYIFNKDKIKDTEEFKDIDENKPFFKMIFRNIIHESFGTEMDNFIPTITEIIQKINISMIHRIKQSFDPPPQQNQQQPPQQNQQQPPQQNQQQPPQQNQQQPPQQNQQPPIQQNQQPPIQQNENNIIQNNNVNNINKSIDDESDSDVETSLDEETKKKLEELEKKRKILESLEN